MRRHRHWGVVGGGILGLTLAHRLSRHGERVTVFEAAPSLGGLASAWSLGGVTWDRHYHVTLLSDTHLRQLLAELALEQEMRWVETRTGCYAGGTLHSISNAIEFLRFPALAPVNKMRLAATILYGSKIRDWRRLETLPVQAWLSRWSGRETFERFWLPLLRAKLGDSYRDASAAFIWATIQRLYAARRTGLKKEMFGYVPGGYARILERFAHVLADTGVEIRTSAPVASVRSGERAVVVREQSGAERTFDEVIVTASAPSAVSMLPDVTTDARSRLESVRYQGIVCASVLLTRPLSPFYLTYLIDEAPFTAVVEMSALVDRAEFGGRSLVYLPKYCGPRDEIVRMTDDAIEEHFTTALERMYPHFSRTDVLAFRVSRVRDVFAIPTLGYSTHVPARETGLRGVHLVTSAQIVNGTLNVNETVALANHAVDAVMASSAAPAPAPVAARPAAVPPAAAAHAFTRPVGTLSLDLDDLWSYLKTRGDDAWRSFPSFLAEVVPRILGFLDERHQPITWFIVGQDAALPANRTLLASIRAAGHEIGNHSFRHEPWLHLYEPERLDQELALAERAIEEATGVHPAGFRGPGYSLSRPVLMALERRGYRYDASTLPTFLGPLARVFYRRNVAATHAEDRERAALFGSFRDGTRPLKPYRWRLAGDGLVELPITTMPGVRTPIHFSYLLYIAERSPVAARTYLATAMRLCRLAGIAPSLLLHAHDFVGSDEVPAMAFFPGFRLSGAAKRRILGHLLDDVRRAFELRPLGGYVESLGAMPRVEPRFFHERAPSGRTRDVAAWEETRP